MAERRLKILQVSMADRGGGAEGSAWSLFREYRARGHGSWLAVGAKHTDDPGVLEIPNEARRGAWYRAVRRLHDRLEPWDGRGLGAGRLRVLLRGLAEPGRTLAERLGMEYYGFPGTRDLLDLPPERPDLVHCHNLHGGYFDLRVLPRLSGQVPVILNLRDSWLLTGHCAYALDCERWECGCGRCPHLDTYPAVRHDATAWNYRRKRRIYARSRLYVTTPSEWLMRMVRSSMLKGAGYRVIPNGIDLDIFQPGDRAEARKALALPQEAMVILLTAQNRFKDYETMEAALARLRPVEKRALLFVCLQREARPEAAIGRGRMIYPTWTPDRRGMAQYYRAADLYLHGARADNFPNAVLEALACGIPVVGTAVGGIPEQIEEGVTGCLVPAGEPEAMTQRMETLLDDAALRQRMGETAALRVRDKFSRARQVQAFLSWYEEVLEDWKGAMKDGN